MRLLAVVAIAASCVAGTALAQAAPPADAPVSTASAVSSHPDTEAQIEDYLASSPVARTPIDRFNGDGPMESADGEGWRGIHGEVSLSVGTGGYRSGAASAVIPIGESGRLALSYGQTDFGDSGGYGYGPYGMERYGRGLDAGPFQDLSIDGRSGCEPGFWSSPGADIMNRRARGAAERCPAR